MTTHSSTSEELQQKVLLATTRHRIFSLPATKIRTPNKDVTQTGFVSSEIPKTGEQRRQPGNYVYFDKPVSYVMMSIIALPVVITIVAHHGNISVKK